MTALYNELDAYPAQWIRNLISAGHVAPGEVLERSIKDVHPSQVAHATQLHLFAGIAIWSHALRAAGWPDSERVWTASCPCQPFSAAGRGAGVDDPLHLWPDAFRLIEKCRPPVILGEQVASKDGLAWLDLVRADLEGAGYAFGVLDSCAAGFGAPHIRQRLYFAAISQERLAHPHQQGFSQQRGELPENGNAQSGADADGRGLRRLGDADGEHFCDEPRAPGADVRLGHADDAGLEGHGGHVGLDDSSGRQGEERHNPTAGLWSDAEWLPCRDGKWRPTQPGIFPLAHGATSRVGRLRAYGNGLCAAQAAEFIGAVKSWLEVAS